MASKTPKRSKIPGISSPLVSLRGTMQTSRMDSSKNKTSITLPVATLPRTFPIGNSLVSPSRIPRRPVSAPIAKNQASPKLQKSPPVLVKTTKKSKVEVTPPKILDTSPLRTRQSGGGGDPASSTVVLSNDSIPDFGSFKDNPSKVDSKTPKADETITCDELNNAFLGLITPSSDYDFNKYCRFSSICEEETPECSYKRELQPQTFTTEKLVVDTDNLMEPPRQTLTPLVPPPLDIFDSGTFSRDSTSESVVPISVQRKIRGQAENLFTEFAEAAGQISASFKMDCDEIADTALSYMKERLGTKNEGKEDVYKNLMDWEGDMEAEKVKMSNLGKSDTTQITGKTTSAFVVEAINEAKQISQEMSPVQVKVMGSENPETCKISHPQLHHQGLSNNASEQGDWGILEQTPQYNLLTEDMENSQYISNVDETDEEIEIFQILTDTENEEMEMEGTRQQWMNQGSTTPTSTVGSKKPKTIFSVDVSLTNVQVESGPGENGDGCGVHPSSMDNKANYNVAEKLRRMSKEDDIGQRASSSIQGNKSNTSFESLYRKIDNGHRDVGEVVEKIVDGICESWYYAAAEEAVVARKPSGDYVPNRGNFLPGEYQMISNCNVSTDNIGCHARIPKNVILRRNSTKRLHGFRQLIPIENLTSSLYAFKICFREYPASNFTASPSIGLLKPQSSSFVEISATRAEINYADIAIKDAIEIKIFPACGMENDPDKLNKSYQKFLSQRPGLIHTQTVDRVILWESGNLKSNFEFLNSITDADERKRLTSELYLSERVSRDTIQTESAKSLLKNLTQQLLIANKHLKETFLEITSVKNYLFLLFFLCVGLISLVVFHRLQPEPEPPKELSTFEKILQTFQ